MIQVKFKIKNKWEYRNFDSQGQLDKFLIDNKGRFSEYGIKPGEKSSNWFINWWKNIRNTKKNWNKVKASPYASLNLALKFRYFVIIPLIAYLIYMTYSMVIHYHANGMMLTIGRIFTIGLMSYVCWRIYSTIPAAKKQIEYYKKYPHLINYSPTDTKETINDIIKKIEENKMKGGNK
jgi:hypothetical protein